MSLVFILRISFLHSQGFLIMNHPKLKTKLSVIL